jgi:hypothetical protein
MKNCHQTHVEDLLFDWANPFLPLHILEDVFFFLCGQGRSIKLTVKYDGSPAFVCGLEPETKQFFLGTKSVFNKIPILNWNVDDIKTNYKDLSLQYKMTNLFNGLEPLKWDGVYQGDFLWAGLGGQGLKYEVKCCPNILTYKIPLAYYTGLGVVLHTTYQGNTLQTMEAFSGAPIPEHRNHDVYFIDPAVILPEHSLFTGSEKEEILKDLDLLYKNASYISHSEDKECLQYFVDHPAFLESFNQYVNWCVRNNCEPESPEFLKYLRKKYDEYYSSLKSEKGKKALKRKYDEMESWYYNFAFGVLFYYYHCLVKLKTTLIEKLDSLSAVEVTLPDGTVTGHEGYCVERKDLLCKLVNRPVFSRMNFLTEKSWK